MRDTPDSNIGHARVRVVDVYVYRRSDDGIRFLLLRRARGTRYEGSWRMIGGKIEPGETAWKAALRELEEETGLRPVRCWAIPSVNAFYEWQEDRMNLVPAFAVEVAGMRPTLDAEHDAHAWCSADEAGTRLAWPEQRRLVALAGRMLDEAVPADLEIPIAPA